MYIVHFSNTKENNVIVIPVLTNKKGPPDSVMAKYNIKKIRKRNYVLQKS